MNRSTFFLALAIVLLSTLAMAARPQVILGPGTGGANFRVPYHQNFDRVLSPDTTYILTGWYFVDSTYRITIPAGTLIRGDSTSGGALIVKRGARIYAAGTKEKPIVFTSNKPAGTRVPGDWGGVVILGSSVINQPSTTEIEGGFGTLPNTDASYGGSDPHDTSGIFEYVRIEFAGIAFALNNEINGLTFGGVGDGTVVDHVQVSYANDDDYEFFGGTIRGKYLVGWRSLDDCFDTDFGFSGGIQFGYTKRDPLIFDAAGQSNGEESDDNATGAPLSPYTSVRFSNWTLVGPKSDTTVSLPQGTTRWQYVALLRRATRTSIYNSIMMGWPWGINLRDSLTQGGARDGFMELRNISLQSQDRQIVEQGNSPATPNADGFDVVSWFNTPAYKNYGGTAPRNVSDVGMRTELFNLDWTNNPVPPVGSEPDTAGTSYQGRLAGDVWYDSVGYRGAFDPHKSRDQQWDWGWTNYDPQNYEPESSLSISTQTGWNMLSVPVNADDFNAATIFPSAISPAFKYDGRYTIVPTLANGQGYWVKYNGTVSIPFNGAPLLNRVSFPVVKGWNLIGSLSVPIPVANISSDPAAMVTSHFFSYNGSYQNADSIQPGLGYWVKVNQDGMLLLSSVTGANSALIKISPSSELPPPPPGEEASSVPSTPSKFALNAAYPNPFNPSTHFTVDIAKTTGVVVNVYDVIGQKVATLMSGTISAGSYSITWNGQNDNGQVLPTGLYFVRMVSGDFSAVQKLMFVK